MNPSIQFNNAIQTLYKGFKEGILLLALAIASYLFISLISYHPNDPSWSYTGEAIEAIQNWGGKIGAIGADILLYSFGIVSYSFPLIILYLGWFVNHPQTALQDWQHLIPKWIGFCLLIGAGCGLVSLHASTPFVLPSNAGGIVGDFISESLVNWFNIIGATLFLIAFFMLAISLSTRISWLKLCEKIGHYLLFGLNHFTQNKNTSDNNTILSKTQHQKVQSITILEKSHSNSEKSPTKPISSSSQSIAETLDYNTYTVPQSITSEPEAIEIIDADFIDISESTIQLNETKTPFSSINEKIPEVVVEVTIRPKTQIDEIWDDSVDAEIDIFDKKLDLSDDLDDDLALVAFKEKKESTESIAIESQLDNIELQLTSLLARTKETTSTNNQPISQQPVFSVRSIKIESVGSLEVNQPSEIIINPVPAPESPDAVIVPKVILAETKEIMQPFSESSHDNIIIEAIPTEEKQTHSNEFSEFFDEDEDDIADDDDDTEFETFPGYTAIIDTTALTPLPDINLLDPPKANTTIFTADYLEQLSRQVEQRLHEYNIKADVVDIYPGPVITRLELRPSPGFKVSKMVTISKDLARSLLTTSVRVVEVIPGKSVIGLELPNATREIVWLSEMFMSAVYQESKANLPLALGKDVSGQPIVVDLAKMPHLLVAGTTGSGKSVAVNVMILSLLYRHRADTVRMIMIDPKMLELSTYEGIPHLLTPVVTDMKEAANALRWCVMEMERRYRLMATVGVRNLAGFNQKVREAAVSGKPIMEPFTELGVSPKPLEPLPFIVVIVDELADMMMTVGKKVEEFIARLAQKARAAGIHLILATQRPSVDVITGLIKANIPTRIAFQVSSRIDSRTILDQMGAETLLGHGDMLYLPPGSSIAMRVHGAFVDDHEIHKVVNHWKQWGGKPNYIETIVQEIPETSALTTNNSSNDPEADLLYDQAVQIVIETRRASISGIQRRLKIGYNRAARIVEAMEEAGLVSSPQTNGNREVLIPLDHSD